MSKKDLAKASEIAVNKFFSNQTEVFVKDTNNTNSINDTNNEYNNKYINNTNQINNANNTKDTHVTNKSKHYDKRGKREIRYGLLLDKQLKEDLSQLCNATGNRSMNDYIVSILIKHTESLENKKLLEEYKKLNEFK